MKGRVGTATRFNHVLPGAARLAKIYSPSKKAIQRLKWIDYQKRVRNVALTCRHFDIQRSLFYKWFNRYQKMGLNGLEDQSTKPLRFRQSRIPLEQLDAVKVLRKQYPYLSKYKLKTILEREYDITLSASSVGRIIKKYDLFFKPKYKPKKERYKYARNKLPKGFKALLPGDLVQADTKHVPFFGPKRYFYVITDCFTKITSIHVSASISSKQSVIALDESKRHFPYPIRAWQNDNGSENLKNLREELESKGVRQYFTRPRTPKDNAFVERMIGTIEREFIQQGKLTFDIEEQQKLVNEWLEEYHTFRPHQALNYLTPFEFYEKIKNEKCTRCTEP